MNPLDTLLRWLAPLLNPLGEFRSQVARLDNIHQNSVQTFATLGGALAEPQTGPEAFTGQLDESFWETLQSYLDAERALAGVVAVATEGGISEAMAESAAACEECAGEITTAAEVAAAEVADDAVLMEVTAAVDVTSVAQGGLDIPEDIIAIILNVVTGVMLLATLIKMGWDIYNAVQKWQSAMHRVGNQPLPNLPPTPMPQPAPTPSIPSVVQQPLTPQQQREVEDLIQKYPGVSQADIENLVKLGYDEQSIAIFISTALHKKDTYSQINEKLATAIANTYEGLPYGFSSDEELRAFAAKLHSGLTAAGYTGVIVDIGGSAVTGVKYTTGEPFDVGRISDYDLGLASSELFARAKALGIRLRPDKQRTGPLNLTQLKALGLYQLASEMTRESGRKVSIMIYDSPVTAAARQPIIIIPAIPGN